MLFVIGDIRLQVDHVAVDVLGTEVVDVAGLLGVGHLDGNQNITLVTLQSFETCVLSTLSQVHNSNYFVNVTI